MVSYLSTPYNGSNFPSDLYNRLDMKSYQQLQLPRRHFLSSFSLFLFLLFDPENHFHSCNT